MGSPNFPCQPGDFSLSVTTNVDPLRSLPLFVSLGSVQDLCLCCLRLLALLLGPRLGIGTELVDPDSTAVPAPSSLAITFPVDPLRPVASRARSSQVLRPSIGPPLWLIRPPKVFYHTPRSPLRVRYRPSLMAPSVTSVDSPSHGVSAQTRPESVAGANLQRSFPPPEFSRTPLVGLSLSLRCTHTLGLQGSCSVEDTVPAFFSGDVGEVLSGVV